MGVLAACQQAPWLLISLLAGAWVDRVRRRPVLIAADVGRAVLLVSIPVAALLGALTLAHLYVVAFLTGILTVFFQVSYQSYVPSLVGRERLVDANGKLEISRSAAYVVGPPGAGFLVELLRAPLAVAVDAASFLVSALFLVRIRKDEPSPEPREDTGGRSLWGGVWGEIAEGLGVLLRHPIQRSIAGTGMVITFFFSAIDALFVLYAVRDLGLPPALLGFTLAAGAPGALVGAALAAKAAERFGSGRTVVWAYLLDAVSYLLIPLAGAMPGPQAATVALLALSWFLAGAGSLVYQVNAISLIQNLTPDRLLGRLNASRRFFIQGSMPLGALAGGALGGVLGLGPTLALAALGSFSAFLWAALSPLRSATLSNTVE
jgi:MFS family permease